MTGLLDPQGIKGLAKGSRRNPTEAEGKLLNTGNRWRNPSQIAANTRSVKSHTLRGVGGSGNVWSHLWGFPGEELTMLKQEGFLQVKEAAAILGVSPNTVRAWGDSGKIPEYRHPVNNYRLYKQQDLQLVVEKLKNPTKASELNKPR